MELIIFVVYTNLVIASYTGIRRLCEALRGFQQLILAEPVLINWKLLRVFGVHQFYRNIENTEKYTKQCVWQSLEKCTT
jgi:hypothetical protein